MNTLLELDSAREALRRPTAHPPDDDRRDTEDKAILEAFLAQMTAQRSDDPKGSGEE